MQHAMLLLAERLVVAMETISQDVKNMSAYVYDISCGVSYLLNENKVKECISVAAHDEGDNPSSASPAAGQEDSAEREYSEQCEQLDETSSLHVGDPEHVESSFGGMTPTSIDPFENLDVLSSENNPIFTKKIKLEEQSEGNVSEESCEMHNMYGNHENMERVCLEVKSEVQSVTDRQDETCGMHIVIRHPPEQSTDYTTHIRRIAEEQARTYQTEGIEDASMVHMIVDSEDKPHKCPFCGKSFTMRSYLQSHIRVHTGERPFKCNICGNAFTQNSHLIRHRRSHTGERPYKCNVCGKAFSVKTKLGIHMRTHTGERPYRCTLCEKSFSQSSNLRIHMRIHTAEKPHKCTLCGRAFIEKRSLREHVLIHTGEKPYSCPVCGKEFRQHSRFSKHMHTHTAGQSF